MIPAHINAGRITFSATLTNAATGTPVAGQVVTYSIVGDKTCSGTTSSKGVASCTALGLALGGTYTGSYAGNTDYVSSTGTAKL